VVEDMFAATGLELVERGTVEGTCGEPLGDFRR
jgi:hypothetical protein